MTTRHTLAGLLLAVTSSAMAVGPVLAQGVPAQPVASQRVAAGNATLQVGELLQLNVLPAAQDGEAGQVPTRIRLEVIANRPWRISGPPLEAGHAAPHVVLAHGGAGRTTVVLDYGSARARAAFGTDDLSFTLSPE